MDIKFEYPEKLQPLWDTKKRFVILKGGRGSGKSWGMVDYSIFRAMTEKILILCVREIQNSIKDSLHRTVSNRIRYYGLENSIFKINEKSIVNIVNGSEYIFKGLYRNEFGIRSTENVKLVLGDEMQSVSKPSFESLTPTIRIAGNQMIFAYNPTNIEDPIHTDFVLAERDDTLVIDINYMDNPWLSEELKQELKYDKRTDYEKYLHKWCGQCVVHAEEQVFYNKWSIEDFETPEDAEFFHGLDFGFAQDATAGIRCFIKDKILYIDRESYKVKLEITDTADYLINDIETMRNWNITADSARPETISHLNNKNNMRVVSAKKGKGSVEDGIEKIRGFEKIIIHSRCKHTADEFRLYKWKKNKLTGEIMPVPEDKHNHLIDALRYALEKYGRTIKITRY